jgi:uncharacterized membrane protein
MTYWSLQPIWNSYAVVALLAAGLLFVLWVRPSFRQLSRWRRRVLLILRALLVLLVILVMLRPTRISTDAKPQTAVLLILADQSLSMQLPDVSMNRSRWDSQVSALREIAPVLRELDELLDVRVQGYDGMLHEQLWQDGTLRLPEAATGRVTDIGSSMREAVLQTSGQPLAAVVLMGDGTQTAYHPDVEIYEAARELGNRGHPLYTVPFGPAGDVAQARDVAVENLPEQYTVFVKNELTVRGLVRIRGYVNKEIPVRLEVEDSEGNTKVIGPVSVLADQDNQQVDVSLSFLPEEPGSYRVTLIAEEQAGELVTKNNRLTAFVTVLEGGLRVLYLEGDLRQEQKYIRWALDSSPDMDLDFQWFPSRLRKDWPVFLGDAIAKGNYDVFILGDCDSAALGEQNLQQLVAQVEKGKGLLTLGGYHSYGPGGYRNTPLVDVLPIEMNVARQDFGVPEISQWHVPGPLIMLPARPHPVTTLAPSVQNEKAWRELLPLRGANRWAGVKNVPGVQVLAESSEGVPLLVAGQYGAGRVLAFAGDSTWQWWRTGLHTAHRRFWRQMILWLARRDDLTRSDVWIEMPQRRLTVGSGASFTTGVRTAMGDPLPEARVTTTLIDPEGQSVTLSLANQGTQYAGTTEPLTRPGDYQVRTEARDVAGNPLGSCVTNFEVLDQDVELSNPAADPDQLARLAGLTRDSGGRLIAVEQLRELLESIKQQPPQTVDEVLTRWQLGDTPQDAWLVLACLAGLLTLEWFLRKHWGLV